VVQVGATVSYHDSMDEKPEPSWTAAIRTAVQQFVEAVNDSSKQLASASERFAVESLQAVDAARARSEQSAETSAEMARQAQQAAEEAKGASLGLQAAVEEARELVRNEAHQSVEQVSSETARITEIGAQVKYDLQQRIDEMVARLEAGTAGHQEALETAQAATSAAQAAADRIETSVSAIEIAVTAARRAAEEARSAAEQSVQNMGSVTMAVASAQEAAESSRQAASLAEQAGQRSDFAAEASMLLERLETDYSLLTRLVQELHSRISSLSSISFAPQAASQQERAEAPELADSEPPIEAYEENVVAEESWEEESYEVNESATDYILAAEPRSQDETPDSTTPLGWASPTPIDSEAPDPPGEAHEEPMPQPQEPVMPELVANTSAVSAPAPSVTIFGRVQMTISPVPDFDKLLSLDSALARIAGVHSVTLADYAREEVVFRVELERPVAVAEFARKLSETAGVSTDVTEASESTVSIRIS
jgi:hypothetical protein